MVLSARIGRLEALGRLGQIVGEIGDQRRVIVAEHPEAAVLQAVDRRQRLLLVALPRIGPGGQQRRRHVVLAPGAAAQRIRAAPRPNARPSSARRRARGARARSWGRPRRAGGRVERIVDVAVRQRGHEGPLDQFRVARVGPQSLAEEGRGRRVSRSAPATRADEVIARSCRRPRRASAWRRLARLGGRGGRRPSRREGRARRGRGARRGENLRARAPCRWRTAPAPRGARARAGRGSEVKARRCPFCAAAARARWPAAKGRLRAGFG